MLYRGTTLSNDGLDTPSPAVEGASFDILKFASEDFDADPPEGLDGELVSEAAAALAPEGIPADDAVFADEASYTGGFTELLSAAVQFAGGGGSWPLTLYVDERSVDAARLVYNRSGFESQEGLLAWVDGRDRTEVRVNGEVMGLAEPEGDDYRLTSSRA